MRRSLQTVALFSAHLWAQHHSQDISNRKVKRLHTHSCITTHHWLQRLGVARVLLLLLLRRGSRRGGVVGRLGLGGGRAAVGHGQLTQVGGV